MIPSLIRNGAAPARRLFAAALILWAATLSLNCPADETDMADVTNTFPSVAEVIGGKTFDTFTDQDIYFMQAIHDRYREHWTDLLQANLTLNDYVLSPDKLLKFVNELGEAMRDRNDAPACINLAPIIDDPAFYASPTDYRSDINQAVARALIKIGPAGRKVVASAFDESHYNNNSTSLEDLADVVGEAKPTDPEFVRALAATAFELNTTNGAFYPRCTTAAVKNLLLLDGGPAAVQAHLKTGELLGNPGRFQAIVDGIAAVHASELATNMTAVQPEIHAKLMTLLNSRDGYWDDLVGLDTRIRGTLAGFGKGK
jgi:hypothetical protein